MSVNQKLADKIRIALAKESNVVERKMFGGLCFMVNGHMCCGVGSSNRMMIRVGKDRHKEVQATKYAQPMDFTGRKMTGMAYIDHKGLQTQSDINNWVVIALEFVHTLPPK